MNRKDFFKKLGMGAIVCTVAPKVLAQEVQCVSARPRVCILGDSTVINHHTYLPLYHYCRVTNLAVSGDTFVLAEGRWNALSDAAKLLFDYVFMQLGINGVSGTQIAEAQQLVNNVNSKIKASCRFYGLTHTPTTSDWAATAINIAIMGGGATPITGLYGEFHTHSALMADVDGTLLAIYDSGDSIHPNAAGNEFNCEQIATLLI